jgi:virginiamycin B lyase
VAKRIPVGVQPYDVAFAFGAVWSSDFGSGTVSRINPRRNRVVRRIQVPAPTGFAVAGGALWVGSGSGTKIYRIDPRTNRATTVDIGVEGPHWLGGGANGVWAASVSEGSVVHVDAKTDAIVATIDVGIQPSDGSVLADGSVWFPLRGEDAIVRIDPETNQVAERVRVGKGPFVVNEGFGDLWVGSFQGDDVWRIRP